MSLNKPRNRRVFFRVSEEEFERLITMCSPGTGVVRSISELARFAVNRFVTEQQNSGEQLMMDRLQVLDQNVKEVQQSVQQLTLLFQAAGMRGSYSGNRKDSQPAEDDSGLT